MTYKDLETALQDGHKVETCTINQFGQAVAWSEVCSINRAFDVSRYRVVKQNGEIIDGLQK